MEDPLAVVARQGIKAREEAIKGMGLPEIPMRAEMVTMELNVIGALESISPAKLIGGGTGQGALKIPTPDEFFRPLAAFPGFPELPGPLGVGSSTSSVSLGGDSPPERRRPRNEIIDVEG